MQYRKPQTTLNDYEIKVLPVGDHSSDESLVAIQVLDHLKS